MGNTIKEIKKALPDINSEKVDILAEKLDNIKAIKGLFQSEGGKVLIREMRSGCSTAIRKAVIAAKAGEDPTPFILDYGARIDLLSNLQDISMEKEIQQQLDEAVKEAY